MKTIRDIDRIILASASPRRKELLTQVGLDFVVMPSDVKEIITKTLPEDIVMELSSQKARDIMAKIVSDTKYAEAEGDILIIGADTIVVNDNQVMGKPKDEADAIRMISELQGHAHSVYTGVTLVYLKDGIAQTRSFAEETKVNVVPMTSEHIERYVTTKESLDKAGAYGIQGYFAEFISGIEGDYNNVVGLPVGRIIRECVFS